MSIQKNDVSVNGASMLLLVLVNASILEVAFIKNENWYWALLITLPLLLAAKYCLSVRKHLLSAKQSKTALRQNYHHLN